MKRTEGMWGVFTAALYFLSLKQISSFSVSLTLSPFPFLRFVILCSHHCRALFPYVVELKYKSLDLVETVC
jgi:hypothetical protein